VFVIEGEIVSDEEVAGVRAVIGADADDVTGVEVAEEESRDIEDGDRIDGDEEAVIGGDIGAEHARAELILEQV
jgi:hypothetical protein